MPEKTGAGAPGNLGETLASHPRNALWLAVPSTVSGVKWGCSPQND